MVKRGSSCLWGNNVWLEVIEAENDDGGYEVQSQMKVCITHGDCGAEL